MKLPWLTLMVMSLVVSAAPTNDTAESRGAELERWAEQLDSPSVALRRAAVEALLNAGPEATASVPRMIARLGDEDAVVRNRAAAALGYIREPVETIAPALIDALADPLWTVRYNAAYALVRLGEAARPYVRAGLTDPRPWVRLYAADTIRRYPDEDRTDAVTVLLELLQSESSSEELRQTAAMAVGALGSVAAPALPQILELSESKNSGYRTAAMSVLARMGPGAREAAPRVREMVLNDPDRHVRREAAAALGAFKDPSPENIAVLVRALEDKEMRVRNGAIEGLAAMGAPAAPAIAEALGTASPDGRVAACDALATMGPEAKGAVPQLLHTLREDADDLPRMAAAIALGAVARPADDAVLGSLRAAREADRNNSVRYHAGHSLVLLTGDTSEATPLESARDSTGVSPEAG